ncbi:MAG: hypothetical protein UR26_C0007G0010 [candidate division TM6 bacterium GW2011_GWF2_32_72]|nr:MAG: hypothetical protein UR26_C0007G0010 [candidate division TM6 bacterium GW2011_GWF2_32_72]
MNKYFFILLFSFFSITQPCEYSKEEIDEFVKIGMDCLVKVRKYYRACEMNRALREEIIQFRDHPILECLKKEKKYVLYAIKECEKRMNSTDDSGFEVYFNNLIEMIIYAINDDRSGK